MISGVTMRINIDEYLMNALKEDITQEDVSTNAVMPEPKQGEMCIRDRRGDAYCGMLNASYNLKLYQSQELSLD